MAIATALLGFNDLGRSVTPAFLFRNRFYLQLSHIVQKWTKSQCGKLKKIQDFCPRNMESCHLAAARRVKLWSLNADLFFEEPHQISLIGPFRPYLVETTFLQSSNCNILGLAATLAFFANETRFTQIRCSSWHVLSKTKSVTPHFLLFWRH